MITYKELYATPLETKVATWKNNEVRLALNERKTEDGEYLYDCVLLDMNTDEVPTEEQLTEALRNKCIEQITKYDKSAEVNTFYLNDEAHWLDFETRDRVYQGNERLMRMGRTETTLWLDGECYTLPIDTAQDLISKIEVYAKDCYNVTQTHLDKVAELQTIDALIAYDITAGYPEKVRLTI